MLSAWNRVHNLLSPKWVGAVIALLVLVVGSGAVGAVEAGRHGVTLWTETVVEEHWQANTHTEPIWLTQWVTQEDGEPVALALAWRRETSGWFTTWKLQLYSEVGILGSSPNANAIDLLTVSPTRGRTYRAALSYNPATGAYSAQVTDVVTGQRLASRGGFARTYEGALRPKVQDGAAHTSHLVKVEPTYVPVATEWHVGPSSIPGAVAPIVLSPGENLFIRINTHGSPAPGDFGLYLTHGDRRDLLTTVSVSQGETTQVAIPDPYPIGWFTMELEYAEEGRKLLSESAPVSYGQVEFRLASFAADATTGVLSGEYEVVSPFALPASTMRIGGELAALEWSDVTRRYEERVLLPVRVHEASVALSQGTNRIPFRAEMPSDVQGTLWRLRLDPELSFPIHTVSHENETSFTLTADACALDVMSFNIRVASNDGVNIWPGREPLVRRLFAEYIPAIIGFQEPAAEQLYDLDRMLSEYRSIRIRPDARARVHNALYYRPDLVELVAWSSFWLSDTPEVAQSSTWGNSEARAALWARFRLLATGQEFYVINTHFHHIDPGESIRTRSAQLIAERVAAMAGDLPVLLMGDFNALPGTPAHRLLTEGDQAPFVDAWTVAAQRIGPEGTSHGFSGRSGGSRIDWVLVTPGVRVIRAEHVTMYEGDIYLSDHYPVHATVCLPTPK